MHSRDNKLCAHENVRLICFLPVWLCVFPVLSVAHPRFLPLLAFVFPIHSSPIFFFFNNHYDCSGRSLCPACS